jgi:hypothetical protein
VSSSAALIGSFGMQVVIDDTNPVYVVDETPNNESRYRARFYFDPNSLAIGNNDAFFLLQGHVPNSSTEALRVEFGQSLGIYRIRARIATNVFGWVNTAWINITDAPHIIEVDWRASTSASAKDGTLTFWIDEVQQGHVTGVDNHTHRLTQVRFGAVSAIDASTSGTFYLDAFASRREEYIGGEGFGGASTYTADEMNAFQIIPPTLEATATPTPVGQEVPALPPAVEGAIGEAGEGNFSEFPPG